ncbi:uncharacterized protein TRIADDRAFT_58581 [Trichoplax adhaerens]|uniref:Uncharacterized protein n=1 Tax=Trichoplax adhaerens TaxID=10228 RepID=B3S337_TRIAD|nr:predicted protein [Trichoplax adhaerens]EDV22899.1 predicted protein [Trichoplax adhaerens]|eukprot:XP_002114765.1 predicted protein [Trichoplax adhaerens]
MPLKVHTFSDSATEAALYFLRHDQSPLKLERVGLIKTLITIVHQISVKEERKTCLNGTTFTEAMHRKTPSNRCKGGIRGRNIASGSRILYDSDPGILGFFKLEEGKSEIELQ